jgi:D-amino-acid dehydrogenase
MKIHIIGGGIIGLSTAWYLTEQGCEVTVIDSSDLLDGTSHGNAGMVVPSHFVPMAAPGVITQGLKWLLDAKSPFYVKPRMSLDLLNWTWQFYKSSTNEHVKRASPVLRDFNELSRKLYEEFSFGSSSSFDYEKKGLLMLYQTVHQEKEEKEFAEKAHAIGMNVEILDEQKIKQLEPGISINARGGIYFPDDAHLYPGRFLSGMIQQLKARNVTFLTGKEVIDIKTKNGKVSSVQFLDNEILEVDKLVICSGSWTAKVLQKVGVKLLLQDGKGYSFTLQNPKLRPQIPTILSEAKVAVTPMGNDLRIGGTLEISNFSTKINEKRLQGIHESMERYYPDLEVPFPEKKEVWYGYRPCSPDGLPYIGQVPEIDNLYVGTGHGMMGMSLGPATGKLLAEQLLGLSKSIDDSLFKVARF